MLTTITLENFKCFRKLELPISMLTLLTGYNAAGKSTSLQGLLLPAQGVRQRRWKSALYANGPLLELGTSNELLREGSEGSLFSIGLHHSHNEEFVWELTPSEDGIGRLASKTTIRLGNNRFVAAQDVDEKESMLVRFLRDTMYISAERRMQQDFHLAPENREPDGAPDVGVRGEYAAWQLHKCGDDLDVDAQRFAEGESSPILRKQLNAWASYLFGFVEFNARRPTVSRQIWLELRTSHTGAWRRSANIGYGLSYAFPVLLAGLVAQKGQAVVVDSPEAHLHPMAQSRMGYFLACMSRAGVQVIVETHSDHVINGVRLAVQGEKALPEDVGLHFFSSQTSASETVNDIITPIMDSGGGISHWPTGFFDQAERDLSRLAGW